MGFKYLPSGMWLVLSWFWQEHDRHLSRVEGWHALSRYCSVCECRFSGGRGHRYTYWLLWPKCIIPLHTFKKRISVCICVRIALGKVHNRKVGMYTLVERTNLHESSERYVTYSSSSLHSIPLMSSSLVPIFLLLPLFFFSFTHTIQLTAELISLNKLRLLGGTVLFCSRTATVKTRRESRELVKLVKSKKEVVG